MKIAVYDYIQVNFCLIRNGSGIIWISLKLLSVYVYGSVTWKFGKNYRIKIYNVSFTVHQFPWRSGKFFSPPVFVRRLHRCAEWQPLQDEDLCGKDLYQFPGFLNLNSEMSLERVREKSGLLGAEFHLARTRYLELNSQSYWTPRKVSLSHYFLFHLSPD